MRLWWLPWLALVSVGCQPIDAGPWEVPAEWAAAQSPVDAGPEVAAEGERLYQRWCVNCHGAEGRGDGPGARLLQVSPGNLAQPADPRQPLGEIYWKIREGRLPMPAYRDKLKERELWVLALHVKALARAEPAAEPRDGPHGTGQGD